MRQYYMTLRNWTAILMMVLPLAFIYLGVKVGQSFLMDLGNATDGIKIFFVSIFIVQAFCLNSSIYVNTPVLEREFELKYTMDVTGMRQLPYWLGTFLFDFSGYLLIVLFFYFVVVLEDITFMRAHIHKLVPILALFGADLILYAYLCGFLYEKSNSAFKSFPILNFFVGTARH